MLSSVLVILHVYPTTQFCNFVSPILSTVHSQFCRQYCFPCVHFYFFTSYITPQLLEWTSPRLLIFSHGSNLKAGLTLMKISFKVHFLSYEYQHLTMFKNDKNQQAGVSTKIEVASRFEKSNRLYQKEAFTSLLLEGTGGMHPLKISTFQCPKMRFPAFWALNWVQKIMCFGSMHIKSHIFLKYFKSEAKSLSRSSKLNFTIIFDRVFL